MELKMYELYYNSIENPNIIDLITYKLLKFKKNKFINKIINVLDKINYSNIKTDKVLKTYNVNNIPIKKSKSEYNTITHVHKTIPFDVYILSLTNGNTLKCADNHLVYTSKNFEENWKYVKDLTVDDYILCENGWYKVNNIQHTQNSECMYDLSVLEDDKMLLTNCITSHNSTTVIAYFSWYVTFHADRNLMITANKESTTKEILKKCMDVFKGLPYFLKPGIEEYSKTTLRTENGCSIRAVATTGDSATGDSINILLIDECALIQQNVIKEFWASVYPTLSSFQQSQIIVLSTPRGRSGLYYELWDGACNGKNGFVPKRVDWWQVPGRDDNWKQDQISVFGQDLWEREFELSFDTNESRLLGKDVMEYFDSIKKVFIHFDIYGVPKRVTDSIYWDPDFHPDELSYIDLMKRRFLCIIDTAEGKEKGEYGKEDADYNIINIFEVKVLDPDLIIKNRLGYKAVKYVNCIGLEQVGIYIDNNFDEEECAKAAQHIAFDVFRNGSGDQGEIDNMRIRFERNFNGKNFKNIFKKHEQYYDSIITDFLTTGGEHGKKYYCEYGAKLMGMHQIIIKQTHDIPVLSSIDQLKNFGKVKNSYAGLSMHDDISVTCLFASQFFDTEMYFEWIDEWFSYLNKFPFDDPEEKNKIFTVMKYLEIYEYDKDDDSESQEIADIMHYAADMNRPMNYQIKGTYGSLVNNNSGNVNYYHGNNVSSTYSSLRNSVTNSRFIRK